MTKNIQQQLEQDLLKLAVQAPTAEQRDDHLHQARHCVNLALSMLQDLRFAFTFSRGRTVKTSAILHQPV